MNQAQPLILASALLRGLLHKLKTPLSVISNDLSYLEMTYPQADISRSKAKLTLIDDYLRLFSEFDGRNPQSGACSVQEVLAELDAGTRSMFKACPQAKVAQLIGDARLIALVFQFFAKLYQHYQKKPRLHEQTVAESKPLQPPFSLTLNTNKNMLELSTYSGFIPLLSYSEQLSKQCYQSCTELFCEELDSDLAFAPLIDAIVLALEGEIRIELKNKVGVLIKFVVIKTDD